MGTFHLYGRKARGPIWQAQVFVGGRRYRFTCHTCDKPTVRQYAEQRIKELAARFNRGLIGLPEPVRLSQVLDRYEREALPKLRPASLQRRTQGIVAQARSWFVSGPLRDPQSANVRPDDVLAFLEAKRAEDRGARPGDRLACVYESFKTRAKALGWPTLRPHDLRHSWVSRKMAEGAPAQLVMRYVGHVYQRRRCAIRTWCRSICGRL